MNWSIHDYREGDLAAVVHLIDTTAGLGQESVFSLAECISALTSRQPAVVAVHQGTPIGAALASAPAIPQHARGLVRTRACGPANPALREGTSPPPLSRGGVGVK